MIMIMLIAFITLGGSYTVFYFAQQSGGWATTNNGVFVDPPVNIEELGWQTEGPLRSWWLWTVAADCENTCQTTVKNLRALHILLNREADRVRRGFTGGKTGDLLWMQDYPQLAMVTMSGNDAIEDGVYVVDPNGNLVFFYPLDVDPELVLKDVKKLLKLSQIG